MCVPHIAVMFKSLMNYLTEITANQTNEVNE